MTPLSTTPRTVASMQPQRSHNKRRGCKVISGLMFFLMLLMLQLTIASAAAAASSAAATDADDIVAVISSGCRYGELLLVTHSVW